MGQPTLTRRILAGVVPVTLGFLLSLAVAQYRTAARQILAEVEGHVRVLAVHAADNLSAFFANRQRDALELAADPMLHQYLKYKDYDLKEEAESQRKELERYYGRFVAEKGVYTRVAFWHRGKEVAAARETEAGVGEVFHPPLQPKPSPGLVQHTEIQPGQDLHYWIGLFSEQGRWQGTMVLSCRLDSVRQLLERSRIGRQGQAALLDAQGRVVLNPSAPAPHALSSEARISGTPWTIRLMADPEEFLAPLRLVRQWGLVALGLAAAFICAWIAYWVRKMTLPLAHMARGTQRLAAGELDFRFQAAHIREVDILGQAFNDMARSLDQRNRQLESRIRQLSALQDMEQAAIQHLDEERILRACLAASATGLSLDRTELYWVDPRHSEIAGRYLHGAGTSGLSEEDFRQRRFPLGGEDILNESLRSRKALLVSDPVKSSEIIPIGLFGPGQTPFVLAPVCGKKQVFGVLVASNPDSDRPLEQFHCEGLALFANALGLVLENLTLFQHLSESEARYRALVENSPVAVLGLSREHHIMTWNSTAHNIFGYADQEILGKPFQVLVPPDSEEQFTQMLAEIISKGFVHDHPLPGRTKEGQRLELSLSWGGAYPDYGMNREWTVVIRDVTELKKLQHHLIQSEKLSAVGRLISIIAHELNNPLQSVVGYAQFLGGRVASRSSPSDRRGFLEDLRQVTDNAARCRKIIDNLLAFMHKGQLSKRPVHLGSAIRAAIKLLEYKLRKANMVQLDLSLPKGLPPVRGNPQQIQQVFLNLLNNACDAMAHQKTIKHIRIRAAVLEDRVRLEFSDSGPGIPEELKDRIFEPFFTTKPEGAGTGLGLAICRQIVQEHGGRIGLADVPAPGAAFWLELPLARLAESAPRPKPKVPPRVRGRRILLVDDEPSVLTLLRQALEREGHVVDTASSLEGARRAAARGVFDLVICDVQLGDGSAMELYKAWNPAHRAEFLFVTGDILNPTVLHSIELLGVPVLNKPFDISAFRRVVRGLLAWGKRV